MNYHAVEIIEHVTGCNAEYFKTCSRKLAIAVAISCRPIAPRMDFTINLDCDPPLKAGEVDYVTHAGKLPAEAKAPGSLPQVLPEDHLRQRHFAP